MAYDVYIGRAVLRSGFKASIWGNPFKLGKDGTREEIMAKYRAWLPTQPELIARLPGFRRRILLRANSPICGRCCVGSKTSASEGGTSLRGSQGTKPSQKDN